MFTVELNFLGDLPRLLRGGQHTEGRIRRLLREKTAVKDVLEACGVPHPEIDLIVVREGEHRQAVDFTWPVQRPLCLDIYPVPAPAELLPNAPRLQKRISSRFVADGHLGKLARILRLLGLDVAYEREADDHRLLEVMRAEARALLTRDRRLLMHSIVWEAYCPRSVDSEEQANEVLARFALRQHGILAPFSRCLRCNHPLNAVAKAEVLVSLADEPLTLRYYDSFRRCAGCGKIYWPGTHYKKLAARVARLIGGRP